MHWGKLVAPIVVGVLFTLWFGVWLVLCFAALAGLPIWLKLTGAIIPLALIGVMVFVVVQRIQEIRSGEEDDLGKY